MAGAGCRCNIHNPRKLYTLEVWVGDHWEVQDDMFAIGFDLQVLVNRMHSVKQRDTSKNYRIIELIEEV